MDEKLNRAGENPVSSTDQALNESSNEAPTAAAEQGESTVAADTASRFGADETSRGSQETSLDEHESDTAPTTVEETSDREHESGLGAAAAIGAAALGVAAAGAAALGVLRGNGNGDDGNNRAEDNTEDDTKENGTGEDDARADGSTYTEVEPAAVAGPLQAAEETPDEESADLSSSREVSNAEVQSALPSAAPVSAEATPEPTAPEEAMPEETMTMEEVMAASDEQLARKPIHRGMLTTGTVIMLSQEGLVVDVGQKVEGLVPYNQLFEFEANAEEAAKYFKPGDELQVYAIRVDIPNSTIILSKKRADQERAWNLLQDIHDKKLPVEVEIVEKVRGGLVANLGVRAFLPASQVDVRRINDLSPFVGKRLKVRIIELNRKRNRVIISRRSILEEELAEQKQETLKKLEPGAKLEGEVVEITDFGAFVNLGGIDGLVHRSEISYGRFNHPKEVLEVGQKVKVEVLDMDLERERINLSMKSLISDPWANVLANYHIGQRVSGKVTNLTPFGAFVEVEPGLEGLIHVSEMSWTKRVRHPKEIIEEGQEVEALVLKIDVQQQRISLGLRQTQPDPWSSLPDRYPPGTEVTGPITGLTDFGVFMEIEEGIEGLVHISELAHEHIEDVSQHFSRGDEVTAVILNIDPIEQRASLSRKRLLPYAPGDEMSAGMPTGAPQSRGGGRKGRRGGRRSQGIDYDYSYAASDAGAKTTTKLGDVYADLFAQFGLTESKDSAEQEESVQGELTQVEATQVEATRVESTAESTLGEADQETSREATQTSEVEASTPEAAAETDQPEPRREASKQPETTREEEVDPENAIDAAEAAALLTAAFRQGKRPMSERRANQGEADEEKETETSEA